MEVPKPFVISTTLNVHDASSSRQSRTYFDKDGATVVEGVRMPDDPSDRITWRNGRVINNVFVPEGAVVPDPVTIQQRQPKQFNFDDFYKGREPLLPDNMAIESRSDQVYVEPPPSFQPSGRDYKYHAGNTEQGRPVYYVVEEPDSLHSDRSPYDFEPADTHTSLSSAAGKPKKPGLSQASSGDFVIKEHTYTMCPGCPTFSIPVPIPKAILGLTKEGSAVSKYDDYNEPVAAKNRTFFEKIGDRILTSIAKVQSKVKQVMDPILETGENLLGIEDDNNSLQEKIDKPLAAKTGKNYMPIALASMAAMALGGMALFASASPATQYMSSGYTEAKSNDPLKTLDEAMAKYDQ